MAASRGSSAEDLNFAERDFFAVHRDDPDIGLYISAHIVRAHGGTIAVDSDANATTFRVTLPQKAARALSQSGTGDFVLRAKYALGRRLCRTQEPGQDHG